MLRNAPTRRHRTPRAAAPPDRVWTFLTEPEFVPQWLGCVRYDKAVGHVFYMQQDEAKQNNDDIDGATHCEILALDAPKDFVQLVPFVFN